MKMLVRIFNVMNLWNLQVTVAIYMFVYIVLPNYIDHGKNPSTGVLKFGFGTDVPLRIWKWTYAYVSIKKKKKKVMNLCSNLPKFGPKFDQN